MYLSISNSRAKKQKENPTHTIFDKRLNKVILNCTTSIILIFSAILFSITNYIFWEPGSIIICDYVPKSNPPFGTHISK